MRQLSLEENFWTLTQFLSLLEHERSSKDFSQLKEAFPFNVEEFSSNGQQAVQKKHPEVLEKLNEQLMKIVKTLLQATADEKLTPLEEQNTALIIAACIHVGSQIETGNY